MTALAERPDPANIVQSMAYIMDRLERLEALAEVKTEKLLTMSDAARELGYSAGYFHGRPWRVPEFRTGRWHTLEAYKAWLERPETERRAEWDLLDPAERRKRRMP